ncbi:MAG: (2Fe-2S) ferredoxin domain-containing protein [Candidatus Omnitrophica bacterium]|nr:(2Fe-2S) ferredoxin domain-containing protein [Candidatus Omnitrophota bacterium]
MPANNPFVMAPYRRHIFICTGPRCARQEVSSALYQWLKKRLTELKFNEGPDRVLRSQCSCFGICQKGPLAVVYPEGIWYQELDEEKLEQIIQKHFIQHQPAKDFILYAR